MGQYVNILGSHQTYQFCNVNNLLIGTIHEALFEARDHVKQLREDAMLSSFSE
jgi:hypothetical protein